MKVKAAKSAGFCFGVQRAVDTVRREALSGRYKHIFTYGPVVHNIMVTGELADMGVKIAAGIEEIRELSKEDGLSDSCIIIRAHGISDSEYDILNSIRGLTVVDATCPYVAKIHDIVREHSLMGETVIVTGDPDHPEVKGITGCIKGEYFVIPDTESAELFELSPEKKVCLVSQTTFNHQKFEDIVDILKKKLYYVTVVNTICNATLRRQSETLLLSRECDAMIVIGGRDSSNTRKLYDICRSVCRATYFIQCSDDLKLVTIDDSVRCIGITAGASTPKTIIEEVLNYVRTEF